MNDDGLRLSDSERDAAAADLGEHYAQGRLTAEEHDERLTAVWSAKTRGELPGLFADLPSPFARAVAPPAPALPLPAPPAHRPRFEARRLRGLPAPLKAVIAVLLAVLVIAHLPLVLLAGIIWIVVARSHGRPPFRRAQHAHWQQQWQPHWQHRGWQGPHRR